MSNEMIKRVAAVIAEPRARYVVKISIDSLQWQLWYIEAEEEFYITSYGKLDKDHNKAENECERLNNELLARFAIEAMREPILRMITEGDIYVGANGVWRAMIDAALKR